ncbi:MAG TPA: demethoxyubiquinone hydroxylase family protein, partial [Candidatus Sulfotelmatobacter sp.]|nr:demethoxyubiquinone hydroxylase family protein [Candidatus Sulfotelmatobacter sp.]
MSKQTIVTNAADVARFRENLQAEYDAIALYSQLAKAEPNADLAKVYQRLAETERRHADVWADKLRQVGQPVPPMRPSWRSRTLSWLAARFGTAMVLPTISGIEQGASSGYDHQADAVALGMPGDERSHARVFRYLSRVTPGMEG